MTVTRHARRTTSSVVAAVASATVVLTSCAPPGDEPPEGAASAVATSAAPDPVGLVGLWRVTGAEGEGPDTWLRLDGREYQLWRDRGGGFVEGGWRAAEGAFVGSPPYAVVGSRTGPDGWPEVPWLRASVAYAADGDGWALLDADGAVVATLRVDGAPEVVSPVDDSSVTVPEVTEEVRVAFADPAPLPDGLEPAAAQDLLGRWVPSVDHPTDPYVDVLDDGTWIGSDGCNEGSGAWAVQADGRLLATGGPMTEQWCEGESVPRSLEHAAHVGLDDGLLVLLDTDGTEITRLARG